METPVDHSLTYLFPRIYLHGNVFITQRHACFQESVSMETPFDHSTMCFQESVSMETCLPTCFLAVGLRVTVYNAVGIVTISGEQDDVLTAVLMKVPSSV
jgi:hypothetical protein